MSIQLLFAIHWQVWLIPALTLLLGWMRASKARRSWVSVRESIVWRVLAPLCCYWWGWTHFWETWIIVGTISMEALVLYAYKSWHSFSTLSSSVWPPLSGMDRHVLEVSENIFIWRGAKQWCWGRKPENIRLGLGKLLCQKTAEGFLDKGEVAKKACNKQFESYCSVFKELKVGVAFHHLIAFSFVL